METIERAPADHHRCPRCGDLVEYKGRGRRPVWRSADCRTQAALERKGNRLAGVQPRVVTIIDHVPAPPPTAPARSATPSGDFMVHADAPDHRVTERAQQPHRRTIDEWTDLLDELRAALTRGQIYDRELRALASALSPVLDAYERCIKHR